MAGEFTLAEFSKIETDPLKGRVMDTLLMEASVMELLPWETTNQLFKSVVRMGTLPSVGFRKISEGYSVGTAALEQRIENISLLGGYFDTDKAIARAANTIEDARKVVERMMAKAIAYKFNDKFINGNPESDPEEFKGLWKRADSLYDEGYTGQKFSGVLATAGMGIIYTAAAGLEHLNKLDELMYAIKGHNPNFLLMNSTYLLCLRSILRANRLLDTTKDMFDRIVDVYQSARLVDIGVTEDQSTEIILCTETAAGAAGSSEHTSVYAVKFGVGEYMWGIQEYPLEVTDKGLLEDKPVYRTEMDWPVGLAVADPYSIARMYGVIASAAAS